MAVFLFGLQHEKDIQINSYNNSHVMVQLRAELFKLQIGSCNVSYYAERNNLFNEDFSIDLDELKQYFYQTYKYFEDNGFFDVAYNGVIGYDEYNHKYPILPRTMSPSKEIFFMHQLRKKENIFPIWENYDYFSETELFTIIEMLYDHIAYYDYKKSKVIKDEPRSEFATHFNNLLKRYKDGYYLDESQGFIMAQPNDALKELMNASVPETINDTVLEQLRTATRMFYRFSSNEEEKKKAINILADILEPIRDEVKDILNDEYNINKKKHDKIIFDVLNNFQIRHNTSEQLTEYNKPIWYDWMMQYYVSVILTYYRLIQHREPN